MMTTRRRSQYYQRRKCCFGVPSAACTYRRPTGTLVAIVCVFVPGKISVLHQGPIWLPCFQLPTQIAKGASFITQQYRRTNHCTKWIFFNCESSLLRKKYEASSLTKIVKGEIGICYFLVSIFMRICVSKN